jgi:hypothetical protein
MTQSVSVSGIFLKTDLAAPVRFIFLRRLV